MPTTLLNNENPRVEFFNLPVAAERAAFRQSAGITIPKIELACHNPTTMLLHIAKWNDQNGQGIEYNVEKLNQNGEWMQLVPGEPHYLITLLGHDRSWLKEQGKYHDVIVHIKGLDEIEFSATVHYELIPEQE